MRMILRKGLPKTRKGLPRMLERFDYRRRHRCRVGVRQRDEDARDPELPSPLRRKPREHDVRPAILIAHHFDLPPANAPRRRVALQRLVDRLLGGQPRRDTLGGIRLGATVFGLPGGQQPVEDMAALVGQHVPHPLYFDEIHTHADDAHRVTNSRRRDTRPSSSSTTRYAPLTIRRGPARRSQAYSVVPAGSAVEITRSPANV